MNDETKEALRSVVAFAVQRRNCACGGGAETNRPSQLREKDMHTEGCPVPIVSNVMDKENIDWEDLVD